MAEIEEIKTHFFIEEQLAKAFDAWFQDYQNDPTAFGDYDAEDFDNTNYGKDSAAALIKYLNKESN